jgi:hypothetical protein
MNSDNDVDKEAFDEPARPLKTTGEIEAELSGGQVADGTAVTVSQAENGRSGSVEIHAYSDDHANYHAWLKVNWEYDPNGYSCICTATAYKATDNGRKKGNVYLSTALLGTPWYPDELTNDDAHQDGTWHSITGSSTVVARGNPVAIGFRYTYDRAGTGDVGLSGHEIVTYVPYVPPVPHIDPIKNVAGSPYNVVGSGGVVGGLIYIVLANTNTTIGTADGRSGTWSTPVSFPASVNTTSIQAFQRVNGRDSDRTAPLQIYRAALTYPKSNETVSTKGLIFRGIGAPGSSVLVVRSPPNHGVVLSKTTYADDQGNWEAPLTASLPNGPVSVSALVASAGTTSLYTLPVVFDVVLPPAITDPAANSLQDGTFRVGGTGGLAGANMEVLHDTDHDIKVGEAQVNDDKWSVDVTVGPGRRSLVARQTYKNTPSDVSTPRSFDVRPLPLTNVDVSYPSASSIKFAGLGLNGSSVEIRKVSGPNATMPPVASVVSGQWTARASGWPFGSYQLEAFQKMPNNAGGWIESLPFPFTVIYAVPVPYDVSSNTDYQPTLTGIGVFRGVVSFFDPDESTKVAPDAAVNASDVWSSQADNLWGPTWQRKVHIRQSINGQHSAFIVHNLDIPPKEPVIEAVEKDSLTPLISGTCWNGASVQLVFDNDGIKRDATVIGERWTFQTQKEFEPDTTHTVEVTQIAAQQTSPAATATFKVERSMIVPQLIFPAEAEKVDRNPRVRGSDGMKGATVILYDVQFGNELGRTSAPLVDDGEWIIELNTLSFRLYTVQVMQQIGERESDRSEWSTFTVELKTSITVPLPGLTCTRDADLEGKGLEGGEVDLYLGNASEPFARRVPVGPDGYWRTTAHFDVGIATVRARQFFESEVSEATVTFRVVPKAAFIETPATGEHVGGRAVVSGFAVAGDTVTVMLGDAENTVLGTTTVEGDGTWSVEVNIVHSGGEVDLVVVSSLGDFVSDASPLRPVILGTYKPDFTLPSPGATEQNPVHFAGTGKEGEGTLWKWFNPEETMARNVPVSDTGWSVDADGELPDGGAWVGFSQTLASDEHDATLSDRVNSERFEVEGARNTSLKIPDKR